MPVNRALRTAYEQGIVLSGLSAGAICRFRYGSSDSWRHSDPGAPLIRVRGLGLINATFCPHYDVEEDRRPALRELMRRTPGVAIALDNCCAIETVEDHYGINASRPGANAYRAYWSKAGFREEVIPIEAGYRPLERLLCR